MWKKVVMWKEDERPHQVERVQHAAEQACCDDLG
jgi:hypothetical protein